MGELVKTVESSKVPPGSMVTVRVGGDAVLIANVDGRFFGMGAICSHEEWDLSEGVLEGTAVTCPGHGTVWDLRTGKGVFDEPLPDEPLYEVTEDGGFLFVRRR